MTAISPDVFRGGTYTLHPDILLDTAGEMLDAVLVVDQGYVAALGSAQHLPERYRRLPITRLAGCAIVPGFVDVHHHVIEPFAKALTCGEPAQMWRRIWMPLEATATPRNCYLGAKWTFVEALRGGVTTIVEHAIRSRDCVEAVHQAAAETGIRLVSSTGAYDLKNFSTAGVTLDASSSVDQALRQAEKHIEDCHGYSRIKPSLACGTVQSNSGGMIAALSAFCAERKIPFQIHANEHTLEVHACIEAYGKRPIEYLHSIGALGPQTLIAHAVLVTPSEIRLLQDTNTAVAYNPVASIWKGNGVAPVLEYLQRGIRVGLGSDATRNDGFRMIDAAEACQRLAFGIPNDDFSSGAGWRWVHAATQGGADACGLGSKIGALVPGRHADFLILDRRGPEVLPSWDFTWELVRYYDRADIAATVVDGQPVMLGGRSTVFDSEAFIRDALAEGEKWIRDTEIIRLHGTSRNHRDSR
jgi:cytosine/adenosine deaminase-related metal-dependent hydrolase